MTEKWLHVIRSYAPPDGPRYHSIFSHLKFKVMKWIVIDDATLPPDMKNKKLFRLMKRSRGTAKDFDPNIHLKLKQMFGKDFEIWAQFQGLGKREKRARRKYEIFCGGFLYYHDVEYKKYQAGGPVNNKYPVTFIDTDGKQYPSTDFEHMIFFEWVESSKDKLKLRIYINSTPPVLNTNPPPPPKPPPPES